MSQAFTKIKVALADDHKLFRKGLAGLITRFGKYNVLFEADNGLQLIEEMKRKNVPEIVLIDINMPDMDGFETVRWLRQYYPQVKILILSMLDDEISVIRMLRLGIKGYLLKDTDPEELDKALQAIHFKGYYYTEFIAGKLMHILEDEDDEGFITDIEGKINSRNTLTEKEIEFLKLCCSEITYKDIAAQMSISTHTCDNYRETLFEKLGVRTRIGLALYAVKHKLVYL
jgi:two-component system, NarL family, invasion response regulator UvrY